MRKFYLFFAGALLSIPAVSYAQGLVRYPDDPKVIFRQTFEVDEGLTEDQAYREWSTTPIDTIHEIEYYSKIGTSSVSSRTDIYDGSPDWEIFAVRTDSTSSEYTDVKPGEGIVMFNGADPTSSKDEIAAGVYEKDHWAIVGDNGTDVKRKAAFDQYGEDGGKYYFQWTTGGLDKFIGGSSNAGAANWAGKNWTSHYSSDTRSVKKYRRDLYVRGLDIEEESSYRLTFYIKTQKFNTWNPILYADVMRGYHHQRSAFSMGYKSGKEFSLTKDDFVDGEWEKVTLMTYYINGHESDAYVMYSGDYSWTDDWTWRPSDEELAALGKTLNPGDYLNYVKQPDKFFVRLSFATDSIEYSLDNLTLTKSWIAGCEYDRDKMRIDFGYETNLKDLAKAAFAENKIAQKEVLAEVDPAMVDSLGYEYYFEVWGLNKKGVWEDVPIRSAEYHDDGYMYMFTDFYNVDGEWHPFLFDDYDSVLVTFHNPIDQPDLCLKYNGSLYPKALDSVWVANGKIVPDFRNEMAQANPNIFDGVNSLKDLPPVMQIPPYEEGSFGLASINELRFKFSREVIVKNDADPLKKAVAYVNNENWNLSWDASTSELVLTRPSNYTTPLKGDYEIQINQIYGIGTEKGENVTMHYHFGEFSKVVSSTQISSDWRSEGNGVLTGYNPASTYAHDGNTAFLKGGGSKKGKTRVYAINGAYPNDCGYVITQYVLDETGNMYSIVHFDKAEELIIQFLGTGWAYSGSSVPGLPCYLYFYPAPSGTLENGNDKGFAVLEACEKTAIGSFTPKTVVKKGDIEDKDTGTWPEDVETFKFNFTVPSAGDYVFEWVTKDAPKAGVKNGVMISNYTISSTNAGNLSTPYVSKLNKAVENAQAKLAAAEPAKYRGDDYNTLAKAIEEGDAYMGNFPSKYDSVVAHINAIINTMSQRMDTIDLFYAEEKDVADLLASFTGDSAKYQNLDTYKALKAHKETNSTWDCTVKTTREIALEIEAYKAEVKALDSRMALIDNFADEITATQALINAKDARTDYEEYNTMVAGSRTASVFDIINTTDDELNAALEALLASRRGYIFRFDYEIAKTRQIKELYALAESLGHDFGGKDIKSIVDALEDDDVKLSEVLREASILEINKVYASKNAAEIKKIDSLDVSALIPNYFLYNEAQVGRDMEKNSSGNWRLKRVANTTAIPGWTMTPSSGNWYFVKPSTGSYVAGAYMDWEAEGHTFIGGLRSATQTKGVLTTEVVDLPEGYYKVGLYAYNQTSDLAYVFKTDSVEYSGKVNTDMNGGSKFNFKEVGMDSVLVAGNLIYTIDQKSSSGSEFEMRNAVLRLRGVNPACDYAAAVAKHESKFNELVTIVDAPVLKAGVEYFNLSGMKIDAPKAGEIVIRKTTENGKVVVNKVLIK